MSMVGAFGAAGVEPGNDLQYGAAGERGAFGAAERGEDGDAHAPRPSAARRRRR